MAISRRPTASLTTIIAVGRSPAAIATRSIGVAVGVGGPERARAPKPTAISRKHEIRARPLRGGQVIKAGAVDCHVTGSSR